MTTARTRNKDLPPRMRLVSGTYYYDTISKPRKWINLGRDRATAMRRWADLDCAVVPAGESLFKDLWTRYEREVLPTKALATQQGNRRESIKLLIAFGAMEPADIKPKDVRAFLDERSKDAKVRATREKALLSHMLNKAREWGWMDTANPCAGVKGWKSERDR